MAIDTKNPQFKFAIRLRKALGPEIFQASQNTGISQAWLAGIFGNENAKLDPTATRFERHLHETLKLAKDGRGALWGVWDKQRLAGYSKDDLKLLASSHGLGQILGLHHRTLGLTLEQMVKASLAEQVKLTGKLMTILARKYVAAGDYESVLRIWNTGSPTGRTHADWYVPRAHNTAKAYTELLTQYPTMEAFLEAYSDE